MSKLNSFYKFVLNLLRCKHKKINTVPNIISTRNNYNVHEKTVILVPVASAIEPVTDAALRDLEKMGITVWRKYGWSAIDQGRCVLAQEALDAGFEHLFWVDSDISFWPNDILKIINYKLDFVTAPYSVKGWPVLTTVYKDKKIQLGQNGKIYEVEYAATGFMYTHKSVYTKIIETHNLQKVKIWGGMYEVYPYFLPILLNGEYLGEDFAFCHRAKEAGIKIYSDTSTILSHIGKYEYGLSFIKNGVNTTQVKDTYYIQKENQRYG